MAVPFGMAFPPTCQPRFGGAFSDACPSEIKTAHRARHQLATGPDCPRAASAANHIRLNATELGMAKNALLRRAIQGCGLLEIALKVVFLNSGATGVADGR